MGTDWIAIDKGLARKPEFLALLSATGESVPVIGWRLFEFWGWVDDHVSASGRIEKITLAGLESLFGGREVFWRAMIDVGWLRDDGATLIVPEWKKRFGKGAKARKLNNERARRYRENKRTTPPRDASRSVARDASRENHANHALRRQDITGDDTTGKETTSLTPGSSRASTSNVAPGPAAAATSAPPPTIAATRILPLTSDALKRIEGKDVDWESVRPVCTKIVRELGVDPNQLLSPDDRSLVLKVAALAQLGCLSENELWDSCVAVKKAYERDKPPEIRPFGYWHSVLANKCADRSVTFTSLLAKIVIPPELLQPSHRRAMVSTAGAA